jgi:cyclopropane fatty-acyl-phospholipid synthase-like methyltransferase
MPTAADYPGFARDLYEAPIPFWKRFLGEDLHFHLGHFPSPEMDLVSGMRTAVRDLALRVPRNSIRRVLDIGCGWGGPAFDLARLWDAEVVGLTVSRRQARYVNSAARKAGLHVKARTANIESLRPRDRRTFDLIWMDEVMEHIVDRWATFQVLHDYLAPDGVVAIDVCCRAPRTPPEVTSSRLMGVCPLDSVPELERLLRESGWQTLELQDCTDLTLPVWDLWIRNLSVLLRTRYHELAFRLAVEFVALRQLYHRGLLRSIQLIATPSVLRCAFR